MDRGAWPFSVGGVICLVNSVSVFRTKNSESYRVFKYLHDSNSNFRPREGILNEFSTEQYCGYVLESMRFFDMSVEVLVV